MKAFNSKEYFRAHEKWEELWRDMPESEEKKRHFVQGLIMIAAALHHYERKEFPGCKKLFEKGLALLAKVKNKETGVELEKFLSDARNFYLKFLQGTEIKESDFPLLKQKPVRSRPSYPNP